MRVPKCLAVIGPVDRHQSGAGFDQAPGEQATLPVRVPTVPVADRRGFARQIERGRDGRREEQVESFCSFAKPV